MLHMLSDTGKLPDTATSPDFVFISNGDEVILSNFESLQETKNSYVVWVHWN